MTDVLPPTGTLALKATFYFEGMRFWGLKPVEDVGLVGLYGMGGVGCEVIFPVTCLPAVYELFIVIIEFK